MAESYSVTAVLSAQDKNFSSVFGSAQGAADSLTKKLTSGLGFGVLVGVGQKAFSALTSAASGFVGELEGTSAAWQTFEKNASMNGHAAEDIAKTKAELQDFATQTIYSASDMATTYAQLDAVGIQSAESLVKGFGGIAAAAENPAQAMKTLSQQGVQMAAKPKVAWQDFKLMLEQTPAGIAAVAKEMGMTTSEMVQAVQDGKIATQDFFDAVEAVGTSDAFTDMATQYKTVGQAMDGLTETVTNKLMPSFELFQDIGIDAVESVIDKLDEIDGKAIAGEVKSVVDAFAKGDITGVIEKVGGYVDKLPEGIKKAGAAASALGAISIANSIVDSGVWKMGMAGISSFSNLAGTLPEKVGGALSKTTGAFSKFNPVKTINKNLNGARRSFKNFGSAMDAFGGDVAASLEAISPKLSNAGLKIWSAFDSVGNGVSSKGSKIVGSVKKSFNRLSQTVGSAASAISGRAGTILKPFQTILGGITGFLGKISGAVLGVGGKLAGGLQTMMGIAMKALLPAALIGAALAGLGVLYSKFGDQINNILQMAQEKGPQFITNLVAGITSRLPALIASGAQLVSELLTTITANIPAVIAGGVSIVTTLVMGVASAAPELIGKATELIGTFAVSVISAIPQLITAGMALLASLAQGVAQNLPVLAQYAMQAVMSFAQGIISNLPQILASAVQIVFSLVTGIVNMIPVLISSGIQLITYLAQSFIQNLPMIIQTGIQVIGALVMGLIQAVPLIVQGAVDLVKSLIDTIINTDWIKVGGDIIDAIGNGIRNGFGGLKDLVTGLFSEDTSASEGAAQQATAAAESTAQAYLNSSSYVSEAASQVGTEAQESLASSLDSVSFDVESIMGNAGSLGADAFGSAFEGIDLSGVGTEAATSVTTEFDSGLAELPGITDTAGSGVVKSLQTTGQQAAATARQTTNNVINALKAGVNPAKAAGKAVGSGYAGGIRGESANASSAGSAVKNSGLSGMSGGYGTAYNYGSNIGQGLVDGMRSKIGAAWSAANELAAAADKAIHARAQIGSPSKITIRYGKWIAEGLAVGIKGGTMGVVKQSKNLVEALYKSMRKSTKKLGGVKDAASKYLKVFKTGLLEKSKSDLEYVENRLKKYRDVSKSYNATITALMKSYKNAYNKEVDRIISNVNTKLTKLANTYQTKYNNIISARTDFRDKLQETSLYTADDYGNVALANFKSQTAAIKKYQSNINKLKKLLPDSMMDEILGMSRENGLAYTNELLKKSGKWLKTYGRQYSTMMNTGSKVANTYYSGRLTALQKNYAADLKKIYASSRKDMNSIGKNVVQGMIDGMKSKKGALDGTGRALAKVVENAFKTQLKIHSPSRVMEDAGENTGQGVINGIENKVRAAREAMAKLIGATSPEAEISRRSGNLSLSDDYDYKSEAHYHITVETNLDGRKVGEGVAEFVGDAIDKKNAREERKRGRRT